MFISRIPLNVARFEGRRLVSSPYRLHGAVEKSFAPGVERSGEDGRILWRLDSENNGSELWLYVVSPAKPDFTHIVEQAGWADGEAQQTKDYERLLSRIALGQRWHFRLRANPVHAVTKDRNLGLGHDDGIARTYERTGRGKIKGEVTAAQQLQWLVDRSEKNGFRILSVAVPVDEEAPADSPKTVPDCVVSQRRTERFRRGGKIVTLRTCQFDGNLEVIDPDLFTHALRFGIGRGRGFGCGLLTVAPIRFAGQ